MARKRAESGAETAFPPAFAFTNPIAGEPAEEDKGDMTWEQRDSQLGEVVHKTEKAGLLHLKSITGWTPKWCKVNFITHTICLFNDENDGTARAVIELKNVLVRAIDDDEGQPYVFVLHANKNVDKVTHKLSSTSKRDFDQWIEAFGVVTTVDRQRERRSARLSPDVMRTRQTVTERSIRHMNMNAQAILQGGKKRQSMRGLGQQKETSTAKTEKPPSPLAKSAMENKEEEAVRTLDTVIVAVEDGYSRESEEDVTFETSNPAMFLADEKAQPTRTRSRKRMLPRGRSYSQLPPAERKAMRDAQASQKQSQPSNQLKRSTTLDLVDQVVAEEERLEFHRIQTVEDDTIPYVSQEAEERRRSFSLAELAAFAASKVTTSMTSESQASPEVSPSVATTNEKLRPPPLDAVDPTQYEDDDAETPNSAAQREAQMSSAQVINETSAQVARIQYVPRKSGIRIRAIHHHAGDSMQFSDDDLQSLGSSDDHVAPTPIAPSVDMEADREEELMQPAEGSTPDNTEHSGAGVNPQPTQEPQQLAAIEKVAAVEDIMCQQTEAPRPQADEPDLTIPPLTPAPAHEQPENDAAVDDTSAAGVISNNSNDNHDNNENVGCSQQIVRENPVDKAIDPTNKPHTDPPKLRASRKSSNKAVEASPAKKNPQSRTSKGKLTKSPLMLSRRVVAAPKGSSNSKKCGYLQWRSKADAEWALQWCALDFATDVLDIYANEKASQPLVSFSLDAARMTGRLVPRALKAIKMRDEQAKGIRFMRPKRQRNQPEVPQEFSDRSLANTIVAQDKLVLTLMNATRIGSESVQENVSLKCISPKDFEDWVRTFRLVVKEVQDDPSEVLIEPTVADAVTVVEPVLSSEDVEERKSSAAEILKPEPKLPGTPVSIAIRSSDLSKTEADTTASPPPGQQEHIETQAVQTASPGQRNRFRSMSKEDRQDMLMRRKAGPTPKTSSSSKKCGYLQWKQEHAGDWSLKWCVLDFASDVLDLYDTDQSQQPHLSYCLDDAKLAGRFVPRAMKAISNRDQEARGMKGRSRVKRSREPEKSDKSLTDTIVPQGQLTLTVHNVIVVGRDEMPQDISLRCISPKDFEDWVRHFRMVVTEVQESVDLTQSKADAVPNVYNILSPEAVVVDETESTQPRRRRILGIFKRRSSTSASQRAQSVDNVNPRGPSRLRTLFSRRRSATNLDADDDGLARKGSMVVEMDSDTLQVQRQDMSQELRFFRDQYNIAVDEDIESEVASVTSGSSSTPPPPPPPAPVPVVEQLEAAHEDEQVDPVKTAFELHAEELAAYRPVVDANGVLTPPPLPLKPPPKTDDQSTQPGILAQLRVTVPSKTSTPGPSGGDLLQELSAVRGSLRRAPIVVDTSPRGRSRTASRARADTNSPVDDIIRLRTHVAGDDSDDDDNGSDNEFEDDF